MDLNHCVGVNGLSKGVCTPQCHTGVCLVPVCPPRELGMWGISAFMSAGLTFLFLLPVYGLKSSLGLFFFFLKQLEINLKNNKHLCSLLFKLPENQETDKKIKGFKMLEQP